MSVFGEGEIDNDIKFCSRKFLASLLCSEVFFVAVTSPSRIYDSVGFVCNRVFFSPVQYYGVQSHHMPRLYNLVVYFIIIRLHARNENGNDSMAFNASEPTIGSHEVHLLGLQQT